MFGSASRWTAVLLLLILPLMVCGLADAQVEGRGSVDGWIRQLRSGDADERQTARQRLVERGEEALPGLCVLLRSGEADERWKAASILAQIGEVRTEGAYAPLLDAIQIESEVNVLQQLVEAALAMGAEPQRVADLLADQLSRRNDVGRWAAREIGYLAEDLSEIRPVAIREYTHQWRDDCRALAALVFDGTLTRGEAAALARIELGPCPEGREERRHWRGTRDRICRRLEASPDAFLEFIRKHPGILSIYRENEPWLIYLFSEASRESQALRDHLAMREDLPDLFEIDLDKEERVGVVSCFDRDEGWPVVEISLIVRDGRCDLHDAPVPEGCAFAFRQGLLEISVDGLIGFSDETGHLVIPPIFDQVGGIYRETIAVWIDQKCGLIDLEGNVLAEPQFDFEISFSDGYCVVACDGLQGVMAIDGSLLVDTAYRWILPSDGWRTLRACTPEGHMGTIDAEGTFIPDAE